jgi:apolipoprotein N-acyltransferase
MRFTANSRYLVLVAAGAALPFAYAPFGYFWVAPLSFALLMYCWQGASPTQAFRFGFTFGLASFLGGVHWVYVSVHDVNQAPAAFAVLATLALVVVLSQFVAVTGWIAARWFTTGGPGAWLVSLPALWVLTEWLRGWVFTGFGWLSAGYSQSDSWLMGYAAVGGVHLMSWLVSLTAGALLTLIFAEKKSRLAAATVLFAVWVGGFFVGGISWTQADGRELSVALVQGAIPQELKWQRSQFLPTLDLYRKLTEQNPNSDLIIWPEVAIPARYGDVLDYLATIRGWADEHNSNVMLGILREDPNGGATQNVLISLGETPSFYVKRHLVPYGEYFPLPDFARNWLRLMGLPFTDVGAGDPRQDTLEVAGQKIAAMICYEDVFGAEQLGYFPEATLIVNVSNDAWFGDSIAGPQHMQIARVRSAEVGRYTLRATNTGITGIIDSTGRIIAQAPRFEPHVLNGVVPSFVGTTPFTLWGNVFVVVCALSVLLVQLLTTKFTIRPGT